MYYAVCAGANSGDMNLFLQVRRTPMGRAIGPANFVTPGFKPADILKKPFCHSERSEESYKNDRYTASRRQTLQMYKILHCRSE
jgi:hypothetical protein